MLFIVCTIIVIWFVFLAVKPEKDKNPNSNNVEQKQTYRTPEEIEKYEQEEFEKRQEYNDSDYYDSPYDIDFEDDPFRRTEKIYALHEEAQEELDDYYDEEYEL